MFSTTAFDDSELTAAVDFSGYSPRSLPVIDECFWGFLYLYGNEYGAEKLVRADGFDSAFSIVIDDSPTIDPGEVCEAYDEDGNLMEGFEYQDNATGTGIVETSPYMWLRELRADDNVAPIFTPA